MPWPVGDIVLGTFQSCDVEVVGREEMGLGEPLSLLAGDLGEEEVDGASLDSGVLRKKGPKHG